MIRPSRTLLALIGLSAFLLFSTESTAEPPHVVASIQPLHALVAGVMDRIGSPDLLVKGNATPHSYQMRPSEARSLSKADAIFWIGEAMELFLTGPLKTLGKNAIIVSTMATKGLHLLPRRAGGIWQDPGTQHESLEETNRSGGEDDDHSHGSRAIDPHIWLSPANAILIVRKVSETLSALDPGHATVYRSNATSMATRIAAMDTAIANRLGPVANRPFIVLHDAYQYFEDHYGLRAVGAITIDPDRLPGAKRLRTIHQIVSQADAVCVFREPQFSSPLVDTIVKGTEASVATLDPLGADFKPGVDSYFLMMEANADALFDCLSN